MRPALFATLLAGAAAPAAERAPSKQPDYRGTPEYLLVVCGPAAKPVWVVRDGDVLHADRNADGDLTNDGPPAPVRRVWDQDRGGGGYVRVEGVPGGPFHSLAAALTGPGEGGTAARVEVVADHPGAANGRAVFGAGRFVTGLPPAPPFETPAPLRFAASPDKAVAVRAGGALALNVAGDVTPAYAGSDYAISVALFTVPGPGEVPARVSTASAPPGASVTVAAEPPAGKGAARKVMTPRGAYWGVDPRLSLPPDTPVGEIRVTATLDGWPGAAVAPARFAIPVARRTSSGPPPPPPSREFVARLPLPGDPVPDLVPFPSPAAAVTGPPGALRAVPKQAPTPRELAFAGGRLFADVDPFERLAGRPGFFREFAAWDAASLKEQFRLRLPPGATDPAPAPDGAKLLAVVPADGGRGRALAAWDAATGEALPATPLGPVPEGMRNADPALMVAGSTGPSRLRFSRDGRHLFAPTPGGTALVHLRSGDVRQLGPAAGLTPAGEADAMLALDYNFNGPAAELVRLDFPPPRELKRVGGVPRNGRFPREPLSPDGSVVAVWRAGSGVELSPTFKPAEADFYDSKTLERLGGLTAPGNEPDAMFRFVAGGRAAVVSRDNEARLYEVPSGKVAATIPLGAGRASAVAATPDGRTLVVRYNAGNAAGVVASTPRAAVVDVAAARVTHQLVGPTPVSGMFGYSVAVSADGRRVALADPGGVLLFDLTK